MNELKADKENAMRVKQVMDRRRRLRRQGKVVVGHFEVVVVKLIGVGAFQSVSNVKCISWFNEYLW